MESTLLSVQADSTNGQMYYFSGSTGGAGMG